MGEYQIFDFETMQNVTRFERTSYIKHHYIVRNELWHNVVFLMCSVDNAGSTGNRIAMASVEGEVTFRNPYGFIPAELYGILPFEVCSLLIKRYCVIKGCLGC